MFFAVNNTVVNLDSNCFMRTHKFPKFGHIYSFQYNNYIEANWLIDLLFKLTIATIGYSRSSLSEYKNNNKQTLVQ